jgi:hypothetical protein
MAEIVVRHADLNQRFPRAQVLRVGASAALGYQAGFSAITMARRGAG